MKKTGTTFFRLGRLRPHIMPILVWLGVLSCVVVLFRYRSQQFEISGIARGQVHHVAATCTGRLASVPVKLYEKVSAGQVLAVIDTVLENETLEAQLATIQAEIERLKVELITIQDTNLAEKTDRQINYVADKRRFAADVENTQISLLEIKAILASDYILLGDLYSEVKISQQLLEQDVIKPYELEKATVQCEALSKKIEENEALLEQAKNNISQSLKRYSEYDRRKPYSPSVDNAINVVQKAIAVQEQLMNELLARFKPLELKSPINGVIIPISGNANEAPLHRPGENVVRKPGEVIAAGDQIFAVAEIKPREIIAYVNERQFGKVWEGMAVEVAQFAEVTKMAKSRIISVSPVIEQIPERLWVTPNVPQWGRPILITIHPELKLVSGETVRIRAL